MSWKEEKVENFNEFKSLLDDYLYNESFLDLIFRGQSNFEWDLKPSLLRIIDEFNIDSSRGIYIQNRMINEYMNKYYLHSKHKIPNYNKSILINILSMIQHYSGPTRLLDWTYSPYVALFFAVESQFNSNKNSGKDGTVYCVFSGSNSDNLNYEINDGKIELKIEEEVKLLKHTECDELYFINPSFQNERHIYQQGLFSISPNLMKPHNELLVKKHVANGLEGNPFTQLLKIIIPSKIKIDCLRRLKQMNISYDTLFHDLDGLGRSLAHNIYIEDFNIYEK